MDELTTTGRRCANQKCRALNRPSSKYCGTCGQTFPPSSKPQQKAGSNEVQGFPAIVIWMVAIGIIAWGYVISKLLNP